jgi:hypothetical protein
MPRKKTMARARGLKPHEKAFLYNDESYLRIGEGGRRHSRDYSSYKALCAGQRPLLAIQRSLEELLAVPEFKRIYDEHHKGLPSRCVSSRQ